MGVHAPDAEAPPATWPGRLALSAPVISAALGLPDPTPDQRDVIEAAPSPALVVAGAGSGKTETMSGRVVWLVANGHVRRDEVLGLTFTRKAAGELAERIDQRLAGIDEFARRGLLPHLEALAADGTLAAFWARAGALPPRARRAELVAFADGLAATLGAVPPDQDAAGEALLSRPRVSTYNAFADGIVREHGPRIGRDPDAALMSQSGSWLLARRVVVASEDERLSERGEAFASVVDAVHRLAGELLDNRVDADSVARFGEEWAAALEPLTNPTLASPGDIEKFHAAMSGLPVLAGLVDDYAARKRAEDTLDFADQVAGALEIIERAPEVAGQLREQYRVVLLDEYQDTSVIQTRLLAEIFRDSAVMAVGDPNQSIYGWRGASADNLGAFPGAFARTTACGRFSLMVSWRNDLNVLTAANRLVAGTEHRGVPVGALAARPGAAEGRVHCRFEKTIDDEADAVARWFVDVRARHDASEREAGAAAPRAHSGAVLFRTKRHMNAFAEALARHDVPHRILGLGGLLTTPEVVDVVAALRVVHDPSQGSSLIRLLSGPRFAVGVADLAALHALADALAKRDGSLVPLPAELAARVRGSAGADEQPSLVDALEFVRTVRDDYRLIADITPAGRARLREAGEMLGRLRRAVAQPIPDLIRTIELELRLDIELAANETRGPARVASAQLRAFLDEVRAFLTADERGSIGSLLAWLDHAEETDELMPRPEPPQPGVVQLLTVHGSKGLEWDAVAVVRLVQDELPKSPRSVTGWLGFGVLPYAFRGDRDALPVLDWRPGADSDRAALRKAIAAYRDDVREHQMSEERRLAYVAVTRARSDLLLTGSQWGGQSKPRNPSPYLAEMVEALGLPPIEPADPGDNPYLERGGHVLSWPLDPLGARGPVVRAAAASVENAATRAVPEPDELLARLLAERDVRAQGPRHAAPTRIPASRFKDFVTDYTGTVAATARPMPERPYRQTRLGTLFHSWVEQRSGRSGAGASIDEALWERDEDPADSEASVEDAADLERLRANFERSEWGPLQPLEVETEIDFALPEADGPGRVVICKLDAVYRRDDRDGRIEIVDWKTGRPPRSAAEREERMLQLALYRLAYHKARGVPLDQIDVVLYYVGDDLILRGDRVYSEADLAQRWNAAREARAASITSSGSDPSGADGPRSDASGSDLSDADGTVAEGLDSAAAPAASAERAVPRESPS
jgi:DNA helicase-2/ATP-dependent DNA helicase PcrA